MLELKLIVEVRVEVVDVKTEVGVDVVDVNAKVLVEVVAKVVDAKVEVKLVPEVIPGDVGGIVLGVEVDVKAKEVGAKVVTVEVVREVVGAKVEVGAVKETPGDVEDENEVLGIVLEGASEVPTVVSVEVATSIKVCDARAVEPSVVDTVVNVCVVINCLQSQ